MNLQFFSKSHFWKKKTNTAFVTIIISSHLSRFLISLALFMKLPVWVHGVERGILLLVSSNASNDGDSLHRYRRQRFMALAFGRQSRRSKCEMSFAFLSRPSSRYWKFSASRYTTVILLNNGYSRSSYL